MTNKGEKMKNQTVRFSTLLVAGLLALLFNSCTVLSNENAKSGPLALEVQWLWIPPVAGIYGEDFLVAPYRDNAPESGKVLDFMGGDRSYDGHVGTDYAIAGFDWQDADIPVVAVARGTVTKVVDGHPDRETQKESDRPGNFVRIDHGGGHSAYYDHFKKDSILIAEGDRVEAGSQLGLIGSSGNSQWPHVHLSVIENGETLDPYHGPSNPIASRWRSQHAYQTPTRLVASGFFIESPSLPDVQTGLPFVTKGTADLRVFFIIVAEKADVVRRYELYDPDGTLVKAWEKTTVKDHYFSRDWWWTRQISERVGKWTVRLFHSDELVASNTIQVLEEGLSILGELTAGFTVKLSPSQATAEVPLFCRVTIEPHFGPAQGLRRYQYRWTRDGEELRNVTHASRADVLPAKSLTAGDDVHCEVTLIVGEAKSEAMRASLVIR